MRIVHRESNQAITLHAGTDVMLVAGPSTILNSVAKVSTLRHHFRTAFLIGFSLVSPSSWTTEGKQSEMKTIDSYSLLFYSRLDLFYLTQQGHTIQAKLQTRQYA